MVYEKDSNFAVRSQGYGLTMQQVVVMLLMMMKRMMMMRMMMTMIKMMAAKKRYDGKGNLLIPIQGVAALQQLAIDVASESVSSDVHYSFDPNGRVIGCYGKKTYEPANCHHNHNHNHTHNHNHNHNHNRLLGRSLLSTSRGGRVVKNQETPRARHNMIISRQRYNAKAFSNVFENN